MNTNNTNETTKNPYGHLLDKYLNPTPVSRKSKQYNEQEAKNRYGHLLDYAKPDNSALELMAKMEDDRIERRKQMEEEKKLAALRNQERIEIERWKEAEHNARVTEFGESFIKRKQEQIKAAEIAKEEKRKEEERQQGIHDQINGLMRINPELAETYISAMKKAGVI